MGDAGVARGPLRIAIIGGGIGGLSFLLGLLRHCDRRAIDPHLYEAAHAFSEIGAGVGFLPNAVRAMCAIDPRIYESYSRIADKAPPVQVNGREMSVFSRIYMGMDGRGGSNTANAFEEICTIHNDNKFRNIHRAAFLDAMVNLLPGGFQGGLVSFNKRCTDVQEDGERVRVHFADGTSQTFDAVVGCDGVKSRVRNILHGEEEKYEPQFTGKYAYRGLIPIDDAINALGKEVATTQAIILGYGGHFVTFPIDQGKTLNVVAFRGASEWNYGSNWVVPATVQDGLEDFKEWSEPVKRLLSLLKKADKWGLFDLPPAKSFVKGGKICLLGDCAHASTPHLGAGAGMAIEDAAVLSRLLANIKRPETTQLARAFAAYDAARRERDQQLVTASRKAGMLYEFETPGVADDIEQVRQTLRKQWEWVWSFDIDAHCEDAIKLMNRPEMVDDSA
ncbi:uncharacterized protein Z520_11558 [Fonsecaea multimorphosa CBS 102226]|uniref:FAD-binding domain-containing protein n=1 Tax=Fonsecaea multimorphosa CBS 102226 TaxID=1442371 RepID=A0A0D2I615_9EURO|nr:uncharacterized protein Z520_11558 [Fonsecaea multimorphosa CBS 102226]KIX92706.1 hypothetical protein Z520_11558 [Fonsecaea multimorphosa CBS 102226]OAL17948.1 hypothetical protein AYO22_11104 [Fonsecaea multimorphosa]